MLVCAADDKFFMYAMLISCIAASLLLIVGVVKVSRALCFSSPASNIALSGV